MLQKGFMLAGGQSRHGQERYERPSRRNAGQSEWSHEETFHNIFLGFDEELMAEAFSVPRETVRRMRQDSNRGLIVKCREDMRIMSPDQQEQEQIESSPRNGMEETFCTMKIKS